MISVFFQGLGLGFAYVMPIGVQNLLVINSALNLSRPQAMITAFWVIVADILLSLACYFGIGALMDLSPLLKLLMLPAGALALLIISIKLIISAKRQTDPNLSTASAQLSMFKTMLAAFAVTWLNPQAILDGTMLLGSTKAAMRLGGSGYFLLGVMTASMVWFMALSISCGMGRQKIKATHLRLINYLCGAVILIYALKLACQSVMMLGL